MGLLEDRIAKNMRGPEFRKAREEAKTEFDAALAEDTACAPWFFTPEWQTRESEADADMPKQ